MRSFAFSDLNRQSGEVLDAALTEPVTLEKRGKPKLIMMSIQEYQRLASFSRAFTIENAPDWVHEEMMTGLGDFLSDNAAAEAR